MEINILTKEQYYLNLDKNVEYSIYDHRNIDSMPIDIDNRSIYFSYGDIKFIYINIIGKISSILIPKSNDRVGLIDELIISKFSLDNWKIYEDKDPSINYTKNEIYRNPKFIVKDMTRNIISSGNYIMKDSSGGYEFKFSIFPPKHSIYPNYITVFPEKSDIESADIINMYTKLYIINKLIDEHRRSNKRTDILCK